MVSEITPGGKMEAESIFPRTKMVVFDLDCTLTNLHTCPTTTAEQIRASLIDVYIQADLFRRFVQYLLESGVEVGIATYGKKEVALALMEQIFGTESPFHNGNVLSPADVGWRECHKPPAAYNKNNMLFILAERYRFTPQEILLVDDTAANIANARQAGYQGVLAPQCKGFRATLASILGSVLPEDQVEPFIEAL